jgi:AAA+ superfamily predicted ATPase
VSPIDESVVAALEAALAKDPGSAGVRRHLAELLLGDGRFAEALGHLEQVLARQPDDAGALALAARAAEGAGDATRAAAWRRLHEALAGPAAAEPGSDDAGPPAPAERVGAAAGPRPGSDGTAEPVPGDGGTAEPASEHDWDAFLLQVLGDPENERRITLADVGGLDDVKGRLERSFLGPMRNPELRRTFGKSLRGGLLLWGPPGCGKTFLARAIAGELGARFLSIGLHDVLDMWMGKSEQNLHAVFEAARRQAPCVVFLDELDALGHKRTNLARSGGRNVVVQLLSELDGVSSSNEGVFVLGATNQPWDLDAALRRPGRLDRTLLVLPPDEPARAAILRTHLRDRPTAIRDPEDLAAIARRTDGYSGADLRLLCEAAAERALEDSVARGTTRFITADDLAASLPEVRPSTRPWFDVARNFALFANESGEYDELLAYMRRRRLT